ncbi:MULTISPECIES: DNA topology modulation protein [unclassified Bacillus (in: firmicutes)]|uniref:DNA topology modulation protein n=1 Tax=unclassified Bacillus (in: firmicutes) TaxID=185979 RepID=UPI00080ACC74|nr:MULTISPECIES: DNA topology modulation protein [unclassified Bacillus (in: firmicutes)]OCA90027.1 topology modulation protein [Bacillus sp. FJAT-27986]
MKKIMLIGSGGSGKSTLARQLGGKLNINVYHLDSLFWKPKWVGIPKEEQIQVQNELVTKEYWIIDGNYSSTMDIRLNVADTIIFLDIPRTICIYRAFKRMLQYRNKTRPDMGEGCEERFSFEFLKWIWEYPKKQKPKILNRLKQLAEDKEIIILKSKGEVERFYEKIK